MLRIVGLLVVVASAGLAVGSPFAYPSLEAEADLPGEGPLRRYDGLVKRWPEFRRRWSEEVDAKRNAVVFLGDSITQGWGPDFRNCFGGMKLANRGIGGDTTRGMLIRLRDDVLALNPAAIVLLLGTNDIEVGLEPELIGRNFTKILAAIKAHSKDVPIVLCRVFPSSPEKRRPRDTIARVNAIYEAAVKGDPQVIVLDTWTLFADDTGNADPRWFKDLLHLNQAGYDRWAGALRPIFATLGFVETEPDRFQPEAGFLSLFNGRDLTGWGFRPTPPRRRPKQPAPNRPVFVDIAEPMNFDGKRQSDDGRYQAINGRLVVTTPAEGRRIQQLWTQEEFGTDFILKLEFRATPNADSGVFIRKPQLQCRDFPLAGPYTDLKHFRPGDWNELVVTVRDGVAVATCNGELLTDTLAVPATGPIGLEGDRGQMEYRRIRLKRLEPAATAEVVVYGATPAGIAAALAAAAGERKVVLVEPTGRIGGMMTHGLSHTDFHSFESITGPFRRFSQLVLWHYRQAFGIDSPQVQACWRGTHGEPSVNLRAFQQLLAGQPSIRVLTGHRLAEVTVARHAVVRLVLSGPKQQMLAITPQLAIDASYEGDLLAAAGVPFRVGREACDEYGESLAPETADAAVQGYNFRLCMTQRPDNRVPLPVPAGYRRDDYAGIVPLVEANNFDAAFGYPGRRFLLKAHLPALPNGKHDINDVSKGLVRLSLPGENGSYPEGDRDTRRRIEQEHLNWQLGLIHFLQTDPALPEAFRREAKSWGLCRDEFTESAHLPEQIYVREARRMVGLRVFTENDTAPARDDARAVLHADAIAVGDYSHNCHGTGHEGPRIGGRHTGEFYKAVPPYQIPYGTLIPKKLRNLFVPTACSASHVGLCAIRLEPIWMALGEAAGIAAGIVLERDCPVQDIPVKSVQQRIWSRGGATIYVSDVPPDHPDFVAVQWWGTLGGLHGLAGAPPQPGTRGKHIVSQYFEACPGHVVGLNEPVGPALANRWRQLARREGIPADRLTTFTADRTRGEWIRTLFAEAQDTGQPVTSQSAE